MSELDVLLDAALVLAHRHEVPDAYVLGKFPRFVPARTERVVTWHAVV